MYSGVDLQKTDNFGSTPLHLACLSGNIQCVRILCEKRGLNLEPKDQNGKTPIMLAYSHQNNEVVKLLHNNLKKKSRFMPGISELWGWLFGGAGNSRGPLFLFLFSVLLWGYPMYVIRVSVSSPTSLSIGKIMKTPGLLFFIFFSTFQSHGISCDDHITYLSIGML